MANIIFIEWLKVSIVAAVIVNFNVEQYQCNQYFKTSWRSITAEKAKDVHHKGRKPNTITIICEEES